MVRYAYPALSAPVLVRWVHGDWDSDAAGRGADRGAGLVWIGNPVSDRILVDGQRAMKGGQR